MFPDSTIVKNVSLGETKSRYLLSCGIAPYFSKLLINEIKEDNFVLMFDESFNKHLQKSQMDVLVRFWHKGKV